MMRENTQSKSTFSRLGWGLALFLVLSVGVQFLMIYVPRWIFGEDHAFFTSEIWMWICNLVPMYLVAFPAFYLIIRKMPVAERPSQKLGAKRFWTLLPICFFVMYVGNIVGNMLMLLFGRGMEDNFVQDLLLETNHPLKYLALLVVAPVMEELTFRKLLLDRALPYGEKTAVILSGVLFGLFHQNLYQFFYAFAVGVVLAYVYVRSGRIRYSILMHFVINVFGGVVAPLLLKLSENIVQMSAEVTDAAVAVKMMLTSLLSMAISGTIMGLFICGIVMFCLRCKKTQWEKTPMELSKGEVFSTVYVNGGMLTFVVLCCGMIVVSHILQ